MKKFLSFILIVSIFIFSSLVIKKDISGATTGVSNGFHTENVIQDKFNKDTLDSSWALTGATQELRYYGLHCSSPVNYGSGVVINAARLSEKTQYNFSILASSANSNSNISFIIGAQTVNSPLKEALDADLGVDGRVQLRNDLIAFTDYSSNLQTSVVANGYVGTFTDLEKIDVSINIEYKVEGNSSYYKIYVEYMKNDEIVYSQSDPFILNNPRFINGYCGFFWDSLEMDITDFSVYNNGRLTFADDFSTNTLTYTNTDASLGNFHANDTVINESKCFVAKVCSIKMDQGNENIVNNYKLSRLENVTNPYTLDISLKINKLEANSFVGFGFGLADGATSIKGVNSIGFLAKDDLTAELVILKNGVIDRSNGYSVALSKLKVGKYQGYTIGLDNDNNLSLSFGGLTYKFANINYFGCVGVGLIDLDSQNSSSLELEEFALTRNVFRQSNSTDISNNFKGTITEEDGYKTPYINLQKYYIGNGVRLFKDSKTKETSIRFSNVDARSGFGYREFYSEFICEFDILLQTDNISNTFGLSFGKSSVADVLQQSSKSSTSFLVTRGYDDFGNITTNFQVWGASAAFEDGSVWVASNVNIFSNITKKYHFMFVAKNRSLSVYFKAEDDPDTDLGILRAYIPNVNIDGYLSVVGNNNISFLLQNFKVVNLCDECSSASDIAIREGFEGELNSNLVLDSKSSVANGVLNLNSSGVETVKEHLFEIIRFTTISVDSKIKIEFSSNKRLIIDCVNNKITIYEGTEPTVYECPDMNLKYLKQKRFEIIVTKDSVTVGFKGYYDPLDKLSNVLVKHTFAEALVKGKIKLSSQGGNASIDDLYLFSLDNSFEAQTVNYEEDPDNLSLWEVKPDYDPSQVYGVSKKGCSSSITSITIFIPLLALVFVSKKRRDM